jgi:hypothetical protein
MKLINVIKICLTCLALAVMCGVAQAQPVNLLGNPGFEQPEIGKYTNFDAGPTPYWNDDGVTYVNTGVEDAGAHSGTYRAFEMMTDDGAYQIIPSNVPLSLGQQVVLTWWAAGTTTGDPQLTNPADPMQIVGILTATNDNEMQNDPFINTTTVLVTSNGLPSGWVQYSLTYIVQAADVGKYPGVFFNTGELGGVNTTNCFAAYDDFALYVQPVSSPPIILSGPGSRTSPLNGNVSFSVSAINATGYQWMAGTPGSGVYTNLVEGGKFAGTITTNLTITAVTTNQNMDIVVVVSNGSGSVTSAPPANLTVAGLVYAESFYLPTASDQTVNHVGWMNDITGIYFNRIFSNNHGVTFPTNAVYSYNGSGSNECFYGTATTINGGPYPASPHPITNKMAFPGINLNIAQNVAFSVAMNTPSSSTSQYGSICVQMNFGGWYVATNRMYANGLNFVTNSYKFNPAMSGWNQLTVSGVGSDSANLVPVIGPVATSDLAGYITGIGLFVTHIGGNTLQFNNYSIVAAIPFSALPVISSPPVAVTNFTGTTATFNVGANSNGVTSGLTYQWQTNTAVGSSTWANVGNGGQFSGATTTTLSISNVSPALNQKDYRVIVTDGVGSVTSGPPSGPQATLTVLPSAPFVVNSTMIYPNDALGFGSTTVYTNEAGNNNTLNMTATFNGTLPFYYQWQIASDNVGTGAVNIPGATNATFTLPNPQVSNSGYYSLQASNSVSGATNNSSGWVQLTVLSSTNSLIHWSAPVAINPTPSTALTAAQILSPYGTNFEAELFNGAAVNGGVDVTVTNGTTVFTFDNTSAAAALANTTRGLTGQYTGASTGDTNLDLVLNTGYEVFSGPFNITLNNLTVGQLYTVQIFGLNDNTGPTRQGNFSVPTDNTDVSASFLFGDNVYVVGTFKAITATQQISMGQAGGGGYVAAVIVRTTGVPSPTIQKSGSNLQVSWSIGTLLQATNLSGPWIPNAATSPLTISPASPRLFFRTQFP